MRKGLVWMLANTAMAATFVGCAQKQQVAVPEIEDKVFAVTPASVQLKTGILTGELTELKVTERVEKGSGRIDSPPKLTGTLKLKNSSSDQSVRFVGGKIQYVGAEGKTFKLEEARNNVTIKFDSYNSGSERLDPGQEATKSVEVDFPAEALDARKLQDIRLELTYLPSAYRDETVNLPVTIGG